MVSLQHATRQCKIYIHQAVRSLDSIFNFCLKPLRRTICDIEVFDGVVSQYFPGLNSLDILIQAPFESDSFQDFRCASQPKL